MKTKILLSVFALAAGVAANAEEQFAVQGGGSHVGLGSGGYVQFGLGAGIGRFTGKFASGNSASAAVNLFEKYYGEDKCETKETVLGKLDKSYSSAFRSFLFGLTFGYDCKIKNTPIIVGAFMGGGIQTGVADFVSAKGTIEGGNADPMITPVGTAKNSAHFRGNLNIGGKIGVDIKGSWLLVKFGYSIFNMKLKNAQIASYSPTLRKQKGLALGYPSKGAWCNAFMTGVEVLVPVSSSMAIGVGTDIHFLSGSKKFFTVWSPKQKVKVRSTIFNTLVNVQYRLKTCGR